MENIMKKEGESPFELWKEAENKTQY